MLKCNPELINNVNWVSKFIIDILNELNIENISFAGSSYIMNEELMVIVFIDKDNFKYAYIQKMPNSLADLSKYKNDIKKFLFNISIDKENSENYYGYKYLFFPFVNSIVDADWIYQPNKISKNIPDNKINSDKKYKRKKYFYQ